MRRRLEPCLALALALAGCSRDLDVPPKPSIGALGVLPSFQSVAPREPVQFRGAGGVGPYTFGFAQGGQLSGPDATLTADGAYVAGSSGSAQDVVEVTDSRGVTATATVSVGQRIAITPGLTATVPGGRISFQATGGRLPYTFIAGTSGSGGDVTDGVYTAGPVGDTIDTVQVSDLYGAFAKAEIHVGPQLQLYRSDTRAVAPRESVTIIALGGQPPYRYSVDLPGPYDPAVDATILANGVYTAGSRANDPSLATTTDTIRVADSADVPQHAALTVQVGPRLRLALDSVEVFPGRPAQLVASGGKPPYTFGFAARVPGAATGPGADPGRTRGGNGGNRSAGAVNAFTGEYVPGSSPGAVDFFQVSDATSAPAAVLEGPRVGALPLAIGAGVRDCFAGDFNGDGSQDVLFTMSGDNSTRVVAALMLDSTAPWLQSYFLPWGGLSGFVDDFAKAGRASVAFTGGDLRCSGATFCQNPDFWALAPDLAGYLSVQQLAGGGPQQYLEVYNDPPYQNATGTAYHRETTNWGVRTGTGRLDPGSATWQFWGQGWDADTVQTSVWSPGPYRCTTSAPWTQADTWFLRMDWKVGAPRPARPECVLAQGFCPTCGASTWHQPIALAVGDFDGDAYLDLAYILDTDNGRNATGPTARLYVAKGTATGFAAPVEGWPGDAWSFAVDDRGTYRASFQVVRPPGATVDALLLRLVDTTTRRGRLFLVAGGDPAAIDAWNVWLDPNPTGAGVVGFIAAPEDAAAAAARAAAGTSGSFYAWSGDDGVVTGFALSAGPTGAVFTPGSAAATLPFSVNSVCLPDVNADGVPDLVAASDLGATAQLVLGDGATGAAASGTFGELTHQRGLAFPVVTGDFDGDGFVDAVVANLSGSGVSVLWGGGGMLAWGSQISPASISAAAAGDYTGEGWPSVLVQEKSGRFDVLRSRRDGTFDPAEVLTGYAATGGPAEASFFAWPVDLNTARPGIDAMTFGQKGGGMVPRALLVQQGRVVDVAAKAIPRLDAIHVRVGECWALRVGKTKDLPAHVAAVVIGCGHTDNNEASSTFALWGTTLTRVDSPPALDGTQPAFGDWVLVNSTSVNPDPAYSATVAGGGRLRTTMVGTVDASGLAAQDPDTAVFVFASDRLYAVEVRTNGLPLDPTQWTATVFPVTPRTTDFYPFLATAGRLDTDPATRFHAIVGGASSTSGTSGGGSLVLRRTATGYEAVQRFGSGGFPVGVGKLADGSPGDALFFVGDWANAGLVPEIVVRLNDGTGALR